MGKPLHITEALLRDAHAQLLARHTDWDMVFEDDMAHPIRRRLVRATAVGMAAQVQARCISARRPGKATAQAQARTWWPPAPAKPPTATTASPAPAPAGIDRKRAAAGEREDLPPQLF